MSHRASIPAVLLAFVAVACGDAGSDTSGGTTTTGTGSTTDENRAPEWVSAPELPVSIGEGQTKEIAVDFQDADGDVIVVEIAAPDGVEVAVDAEQTRLTLRAGYGSAGVHDVEVTLSDAEAKSPVKLVVEVAPLAWLDRAEWTEAQGPEAREHGSLLFVPGAAPEKDRFVMFGGTGYSPYGETFADAWAFSPATGTWASLAVEGTAPAGAGSRRVAPAAEPGVAYLFGGYGLNSVTNRELFRMTASETAITFEELEQTNPPPRRALHAFVHDAESGRFFVFGGFGTKVLGDTWVGTIEGNTATWTEVATPSAPTPRYGFFYGLDSARRRLVVWSGAQGANPIDPAGDAWALDLAADPPVWSLLLDGAAPGAPPGRRNGCFVFDPSGPRLAVFGGTADAATTQPGLWMLDVRPDQPRWDRVELPDEPKGRSSGFGALDAQGHIWMGFGNTAQAVFRDFNELGYAD